MSTQRASFSHGVAALSAISMFIVASGPVAHGAVVLRSGLSITIPSNDAGVQINVITGETSNGSPSPAGWDLDLFGSSTLNLFTPFPSPGGGAYVGSGSQYDFMLHSFGVSVGPSNTFTNTGTVSPNLSSFFTLPSVGQFGFGFRFFNEETSAVHYGFMYLELGNTLGGQPRRILGYYYESQPGVALVLPAPGATSLLSGFALFALRRRR